MSSYPRPAVVTPVLIVVGAGAAGFFCAVNAARMNPSLKVIMLEKSSSFLSKVRISGGGRCNVTHALDDITEMSKRYPRGQHFVKKSFHEFFTADTVKWFEQRNVHLKVEKDGRMFPVSDSSSSIINCLVNQANLYGVDIRLNTAVTAIRKNERFDVQVSSGQVFAADFVCLACGGYPKSSMYQWLNELGHSHAEPVPSLFTFNLPQHPVTKLMGVSVEKARVKIEGTKLVEEGPVLVTHWGLSGPAILRLSAWGARMLAEKKYEYIVHINWIPGMNEQELKDQFRFQRTGQASKKICNHNMGLPQRLWEFMMQQSGIEADTRFADLSSKAENLLVKNLLDYTITVKGKTTFKEEFVTAGGINLNEVDAHTMMSRKIENLFFAGEILDVDGVTGGFNFQHAWTSGYIAARTVAGKGVKRE